MKKTGKLVTALCFATAATTAIHFINKTITLFAEKQKHLLTTNLKNYKWRFGNIAYRVSGSGAPILLIHNLDSLCSQEQWDQIISDYNKKYTVYTLDLLGCGQSDKPAITYTNYLFVQLITDFVKDVIQKPTSVIASNSSCPIVTMACSMNSDLFDKLIFINPDSISAISRIPDKNSRLAKFLFEIPIIGTLVYNMNVSRYKIQKDIQNKFVSDKLPNQKMIDSCYTLAHLGGSNAKYLFASLTGHYQTANVRQALHNIDNSIYIIYGKELKGQKHIAEEYISLNPSIEVANIPHAKLFPEIEQAKAFIDITNIYLG